MKVELGSTIKAGYTVSVTTWENDGDNYQTNDIVGLSKEDAKMFIDTLPIFKSVNSKKKGLGNKELNINQYLGKFEDLINNNIITVSFAEKYFGYINPNSDYDEDEQQDTIIEALSEILGYPVEYDYGFIRVVEKVQVLYFDEDIVIPSGLKVDTSTL
ncbi:hypothetical protein [Klebsiella phage phiKp_21]|nr:hypothetical protein [Klebsiella phage phiKp_21]